MIRCSLLLLFFALGALPQSTVQPPDDGTQQPPGSVEGRITNSETGDGIPGVAVRLIPIGRRGSPGSDQSTTSQNDGTFRLESVSPGSYFILATQSNFVSPSTGPQPRTSVQVDPGQAVTNIAIQLNPIGKIRGMVIDDNGNPIIGARVEAFATYSARGKMQLRRVAESSTDELGKYALKTQGAGRYYVTAEPDPGATEVKSEDPASKPEQAHLDLVRTFYPKALDLESATPLDTSAGQDMSDTTIQLRRAEAYHIRGKIEGLTPGSSSRLPTISLGPRGSISSGGLGLIARPQADGTFDISKVLPGSYTLTLTGIDNSASSQNGRASRMRLLARQDLDVAAGDVNGIVLAVVPLMTLTGRVAIEGQENSNVSGIRVNLSPAGPGAVGGFQSVAVQSDGSFVLEHVAPGEYSIRLAGALSGTYIQSVLYNRQDVTSTGIDLTQGGGGEIQVILRTGTGEVDGVVSSGVVTGATMMVLVPETVAADGSGVLLGNMQSSGGFVVGNVPPGRYYAFAADRWSPLWQNPDFLRIIRNQGVSVDLPENGHIQVQLAVITSDQVQAAAMPLGLAAQ